jgi:hypothetical protein
LANRLRILIKSWIFRKGKDLENKVKEERIGG